MDPRDRDQYARLDANDELIVELQRGMLTEDQRQSREFEEAKRTIQLLQLEPPSTAFATKAKVIGTVIGSAIVYVIAAAIQNGWFADKEPDPKESPIPVSTYELPPVST